MCVAHALGREENLLGALGLALAGAQEEAAREVLPGGGAPLAAALITIANAIPEARPSVVATALGLTHSGTVRLVDRLTERGLVRRIPDPSDGRGVRLELTPAGARTARRAREARDRAMHRWLAPLDEPERASLTALVERMLTAGTEDRAGAWSTCRLCDPGVCGHPGRCPVTRGADAALGISR